MRQVVSIDDRSMEQTRPLAERSSTGVTASTAAGVRAVAVIATAVVATSAHAVEVKFEPVADGMDTSAFVKPIDARPYMRLQNALEPMPGNAGRTYLELERE